MKAHEALEFFRRDSWDLMALQEVTLPPGETQNPFSVESHLCFWSESGWQCKSAVLVHERLLPYVLRHQSDGRHPSVTIKFPNSPLLQFASAHLPHSAYTSDEFMHSLSLLVRDRSHCRLIVGLDSNVSLGGLAPTPYIGPLSLGPSDSRARCFRAFLESHRLFVCNSFPAQTPFREGVNDPEEEEPVRSADYTHVHDHTGVKSQRDFILDTSGPAICFGVDYPDAPPSDHRLVSAVLDLPVPRPRPFVRRPVLKNWTCRDQGQYNREGEVSLTHASAPRLLTGMTEAIHRAAERCQREQPKPQCVVQRYYQLMLRMLQRVRHEYLANDDLRKWLNKRISTLRRNAKRYRDQAMAEQCARGGKAEAWARFSAPKAPATILEGSVDRTQWSAGLRQHYTGVYHDANPMLNVWISNRMLYYSRESQGLVFTMQEVRDEISRMSKGRTAAHDGVTTEMLASLNEHHVETLAQAFAHRSQRPVFCVHSVSFVKEAETDLSDPEWHHLAAWLIPKRHPVKLYKDLRPITIIPVLKKLYLRLLLRRMVVPLQQSTPPWCEACLPGVSATEPILHVRQLVEKSVEWGLPLYAAKLDVKAAFESLPLMVANTTLERAGVDPEVTQAYMKELLSIDLDLKYGEYSTGGIPVTHWLLQGCPVSAPLFTATMGRLLQPLFSRWAKDSSLGVKLPDGPFLYLKVWMDDVFLFASSAKALQRMITQVCEHLSFYSLHMQPAKTKWSTNQPDTNGEEIIVHGVKLERTSRAEGLLLLGSQVSMMSYSHVALEHRLSIAWGAFFANRELLVCKTVSLRTRLQLLDRTVRQSALWALNTVNLLAGDLDRLDSAQVAMAAAMMRAGRKAGEGWKDWFIRTRRAAKETLKNSGIKSWSGYWLQSYFSLASRVNQKRQGLLHEMVSWRSLTWWEETRPDDSNHRAHAHRHPRRFVPRRWECRLQALNSWLLNFPLTCTWGSLHVKEYKSRVDMFCAQHPDTLRTAGNRRFVTRLPWRG